MNGTRLSLGFGLGLGLDVNHHHRRRRRRRHHHHHTTTTTHAAGCNAKVLKGGLVDAKAMLKRLKEMEDDDGE